MVTDLLDTKQFSHQLTQQAWLSWQGLFQGL